jgi:hypothetical protein
MNSCNSILTRCCRRLVATLAVISLAGLATFGTPGRPATASS